MAENFPAKSTILDGHLRPRSSHAARRWVQGLSADGNWTT